MPSAEPKADQTQLKGKVAWITGGGSGIGLAGAIEMAKAGAQVVISGRSAQTLKTGAAEARAAGVSLETVRLDVADRGAVERVAKDVLARHKRIDILVNSAGTNISGGTRNLKTMSLDGWDEVVAVNLSGLFYCCFAVLPAMRAQRGGLIINVSSWAGRYGTPLTGPAYNATKRAVLALSESINNEECTNGIRATSVLPGEVDTPIMERRPVPPSRAERERMLQAEDLGATLLYLAMLPARACVNELIISPTWNRFYVGGFETKKA